MARGNRSNRSGGGGNQKKVSVVFTQVNRHCAQAFAEWQEDCALDPKVVDELVTSDHDVINRAFASGGFAAASRAVIGITCDRLVQEGKLGAGDPTGLETVFEQTAAAIKKEKDEAEAARKKRAETKTETAKKTAGEIHTADQFIAAIPDADWQETATKRLAAFAVALTPDEATKFAASLAKGDQRSKFASIVRISNTKRAIALARANGWI